MAFLGDIIKYLAELNVKPQGKEQYLNKLYEHVQAIIQKLEMIQKQLINQKIVHFTTLSTRDRRTVRYEKYSALIGIPKNEFEQRFSDFREHCGELKLFSDPFRIDVNDAHAMFQLELIELDRVNEKYITRLTISNSF